MRGPGIARAARPRRRPSTSAWKPRRRQRLLAPYLVHRVLGRSFVVLKTATSLDGRTAARDGSSHWITGPSARADVHELRADSQAVIVGAGTALADRPSLTARDTRDPVERQPLRVVLDAQGRVPADGPLFDSVARADARRSPPRPRPSKSTSAWQAAGAKVQIVPPGPDNVGVDLSCLARAPGRPRRAPGAGRGWRPARGCVARRRSGRSPRHVRRTDDPGPRRPSVVGFAGPETIADAVEAAARRRHPSRRRRASRLRGPVTERGAG